MGGTPDSEAAGGTRLAVRVSPRPQAGCGRRTLRMEPPPPETRSKLRKLRRLRAGCGLRAPGSFPDAPEGADQPPARDLAHFRARRPGRSPPYRHHLGPEPHGSWWPDCGPGRAEAPRGVADAGEGSGERGRPDLLRGGGGGARVRRALRAGWGTTEPRADPPRPDPLTCFVSLTLATVRAASSAPKPTNPGPGPSGARAGSAPRADPARGAPGGLGEGRPPEHEPRAPARAQRRGQGAAAAGSLFFLRLGLKCGRGRAAERLERAPPSGVGAIGRRRLRKIEW